MLEPQFEKLTCDRVFLPQPVFTALSVKINAKEKIDRILTASADAHITSYACGNGEIEYKGRCNMRLLAVDENNAVQSYAYNADFSDKLPAADYLKTGECRAFFVCTVTDVAANIEGSAINVEALLETRAQLFASQTTDALASEQSLVVREGTVELGRLVKTLEVSAQIASQLEVKNNIARVLAAESFLSVATCTVSDGVMDIKGMATVCLTYMTPEKNLVHNLLPFEFAEQTAADGFDDAQIFTAAAQVRGTKIHIDILEEQNNNTFGVEIAVSVQLFAYETEPRKVVDDAYSLTHRVELISETLRCSLPDGRYTKPVKIEQNVPISAPIERLVAVTNLRVSVTAAAAGTASASLEGFLCGDIVFEAAEKLSATQFKLPFAETIESERLEMGALLSGGGTVSSLAYRMDKHSAVISANINLFADVMREAAYPVLTGVREAEELAAETGAIEVCIARKGDTLWEIGKQLNMRGEQIMEINPDLVTPLEKDAKIVIYHQL